MKSLLITTSLAMLLTLSSVASVADNNHRHRDNHRFEDTARVTHVETLYQTAEIASPQRECRQYRTAYNYNDHESYTYAIAGSNVGGELDNQFGNTVLTVSEALLDNSSGHNLAYQPTPSARYNHAEQCRVTEPYHDQQRINGYRVTYHYQGQTYTTYMDHYPGNRIPVEVFVRPAQDYYY